MKKKILLKNDSRNLISSNKIKKRKRKRKISSKSKFTTFWYSIILILILIIILLLAFINLKKKILNSYNQNKNLLNNSRYKSNASNNGQQQTKKNQLNMINSKINLNQTLLKAMNETYEQNGFVNLNEVESTIPNGREWIKGQNKLKEINVGAAFDTKYILLSMFTIASIMDSQHLETKLRLHFAVVDCFSVESMIKIYSLRDKIRDDIEFNFYNAKKIETDLRNTNPKGNAINAKLILPELLPDDVERIIILDMGDVLVLRDLSDMYNWNMEDKIYYGVLDEGVMKYGYFSKTKLDIYINTGSYLVDVKKAKSEKIYEKIVKYKNLYRPSGLFEQDFLNDIAYGKIGYLPIRFGLKSPFSEDKNSDSPFFKTEYHFLDNVAYKEKYNLPKNQNEMNIQAFNPVIIHQWNGKWFNGNGLSIYRRIVQYYIRFAGIWDEICPIYPGICQK